MESELKTNGGTACFKSL